MNKEEIMEEIIVTLANDIELCKRVKEETDAEVLTIREAFKNSKHNDIEDLIVSLTHVPLDNPNKIPVTKELTDVLGNIGAMCVVYMLMVDRMAADGADVNVETEPFLMLARRLTAIIGAVQGI
jgi:hypothetical protein